MADKNLARSGPADIGLLSDDDPLAELARIVGYEPRNVPTAARPVPPEPLQEPAFDLESELLREFARYDAPSIDPVADVDRDAVATVAVDEFESAAVILEADAAGSGHHPDSAFHLPVVEADSLQRADTLPIDHGAHPVVADDRGAVSVTSGQVPELPAADAEWSPVAASVPADAYDAPSTVEPVFLGLQPSAFSDAAPESAALDLDRELELSLGDAFAETPEVVHAATPTRHAETSRLPDAVDSYDAAAAGLTIADTGDAQTGTVSGSIIDPRFTVEAIDRADAHLPPSVYSELMPIAPELGDGVHFEADELPVEVGSVEFVPAWMPEQQAEAALAIATEALASSAAEAAESFAPEPAYQVAPAERGAVGHELDELLAEVERFPVPENRPPLTAPLEAPRTRPGTLDGFSSIKFGRATPVAFNRQQAGVATQAPSVAPVQGATTQVATTQVEPVQVALTQRVQVEPPVAPVVEALPAIAAFSTVTQPPANSVHDRAAAEVEDAFANFELDLSDIALDLDPSDLDLGDDARPVAAPVAPQPASASASVLHAAMAAAVNVPPVPVTHQAQQRAFEPSFTTENPAARAPEPVDIDGTLPFDPSLIADTDTGVAPVAELDVPELPAVEKEKPPVHQPEFDLDIDAEMAQLFASPAASADVRGERGNTVAPAAAEPKAGPVEADDFDKALEEDLRRSLSQPERHAIPLDAQQVDDDFVGDGYDEPVRRRKGLLLAAAAAIVVLGGAGTYAFLANSGAAGAGTGEPRVILADKEPVKIVPEEKGGKTVPNQDKAVYDRVAGASDATPQQEQLVTSTEEPVDVVQRTLAPESLPFDGPEDEMPADNQTASDDRLLPGVDDNPAAEPGNQDDRTPVVSPRKVRTMIVKPDGTLVAREEPAVSPESALASSENAVDAAASNAAAPSAVASASATADTGLRAEQTGEAAAALDENARALQDAADASVSDSAPVRVVRTTTFGGAADATTTAGAEQATGTVANGAPVPVTRPADQPVEVVGTVTERGRVTDAQPTETAALAADANQQAPAEAPAAAANPGGYVIQIASLPSEEEANKSYKSLSAKFSGVIGGRGVDIKRADIPNKGTYFRVRIPAGSREEANALCAKYKSAGGSCLVTR